MSEIDSNDSPLKNIKSEADNQKLQTKANNYLYFMIKYKKIRRWRNTL